MKKLTLLLMLMICFINLSIAQKGAQKGAQKDTSVYIKYNTSQDTNLPIVAITNYTRSTVLTCSTTSIHVTATPTRAKSYAWSGGSAVSNKLNNRTSDNYLSTPGIYTVTVTAANGRTSTSSITITQNIIAPTVSIINNTGSTILTSATDSISVTVTPIGASSYDWSEGSIYDYEKNVESNNKWNRDKNSLNVKMLSSAGTYTVTVTSTNGCTGTSSITIIRPLLISTDTNG